MPLYEYRCEPCDHTFETLVRSADDRPRCPKCGEAEALSKQFSVPASAQTAGTARASAPLPMAAGCGAPACCGGGCALD
jgi:putative FmdB family regulatory protein